MPHELHTSERRSFRSCRRRWHYAYVDGYVPHEKQTPLEFGVAFHQALEAFYEPSRWNNTTAEEKLDVAIGTFTQECIAQRERFLETYKLPDHIVNLWDDYDKRVELGVGMLTYHARHTHPEFDGWFEPVHTEIGFDVPILLPSGEQLRCAHSPACGQIHSNDVNDDDSKVVYAGRVDAIVKDKRYGGYYLVDWKTAGVMMPNDDYLQWDDQIASYCWALKHVLNIDVRGFIYAEMRKDYPKPPPRLKRLYRGCIYSTKKNLATTLDLYVETVKDGDPEAYEQGLYDEYIQYLKTSKDTKFQQRFVIRKSDYELEEIGRLVALEAAEMVDDKLRVYPSPSKFSCVHCPYRDPCRATFTGDDSRYLLEAMFHKTTSRYYHVQKTNSDKGS